MVRTNKARVHWHDSKSGDGMVFLKYNGMEYLIAMHLAYTDQDLKTGDVIAVNYIEDFYCVDAESMEFVDYTGFCNINKNLTKVINKAA